MGCLRFFGCRKREENKLRLPLARGLILLLSAVVLSACAGSQSRVEVEKKAAATRTIGEAYMRQGNYPAALRELLNAQELNPEDHIVYNDLGLCYMAKKMMTEAIAHFKKAIALKPSYAPARNNLGSAYMVLKEYDAAIEVFKEITKDALYATPHYPLANLGTAYFYKGDYQTALDYYKKALDLQPDFAIALTGVWPDLFKN